MRTPICPECGRPSEFVSGRDVYPGKPDLHAGVYYLCRPCGAYVGCHKGTTQPLGTLAGPALRRWRKRAHAAFDPHWQLLTEQLFAKGMKRGAKAAARTTMYTRLAEVMGLPPEKCHIGMFDIQQCREVIRICQSGELTEAGACVNELKEMSAVHAG